jgi:hypothetical protein
MTYFRLFIIASGFIFFETQNVRSQILTSDLFGPIALLGNNDINHPSDIFASDIDNDGDIDIISGRSNRLNRLYVHLNDGSGDFQTTFFEDNFFGDSRDIHSIDLDGDGDEDLISIESTSFLRVYENNGSGGYENGQTISSDLNLGVSTYSADLNGDGNFDILAASSLDKRIVWYQNDGNWGFSAADTISINEENTSSVYTGDLDNDGDNDVIATSQRFGTISWYKNDGNGVFSDSITVAPIESVNQISEVISVDIDSDGDLDILATSNFPGSVFLIENKGNSVFEKPAKIADNASFAKEIVAVDFNNDGNLDIAYSAAFDNGVAWIENLGNLEFSSPRVIDTKVRETESIIAADFNNDGRIDIATATPRSDLITWYENINDTLFSNPKIIASNTNSSPISIEVIDIDNNGREDVFVSSFETEEMLYYRNESTGILENPIRILEGFPAPNEFLFADIDGDNAFDIITLSRPSITSVNRVVSWFKNVNDSTFQFIENVEELNRDGTFNISDIDGDGDLDIIVNSFEDGTITLHINENGRFENSTLITNQPLAVSDILVLDIDTDSQPDILAYSFRNSVISLFKNQGSGVFPSLPDTSITNVDISDFGVEDMDNDENLDIVVAAKSGVFTYTGFEEDFLIADTISTLLNFNFREIYLNDFNNDELVDIIGLNGFNRVFFIENSSDGFLDPTIIETELTVINDIAGADINGDMFTDILFYSSDTDQVGWIENINPLIDTIERNSILSPSDYTLHQNYPNPFNPSTTIKFELSKAANVRLSIFNMLGQKVAELVNAKKTKGFHSVTFDATNLSSGMYIYRIQVGDGTETKKLLLIK